LQFFLLLFILVPIIEIGVFIQAGDILGLSTTILIVFITAIIGVNLLKQQGLKAWTEIQIRMSHGQVPALEMASAAQLLFAGGLLLTPGFVTDFIGFSLMIPAVRMLVAKQLMKRWTLRTSQHSQSTHFYTQDYQNHQGQPQPPQNNRTIEGEFEDKSK